MAEKNSIAPGIILIVIGVVFLLQQLDIYYFRWRQIYPVGMLALSIYYFLSMPGKKDKSVIFPAVILLILGVFFFLRNFNLFDFDDYFYSSRYYWPVFLIAFGAGFTSLFFVREDDWGVLIPGGILLFLGVTFFLRGFGFYFWEDLRNFWPVILIVIGGLMIFKSLRNKAE